MEYTIKKLAAGLILALSVAFPARAEQAQAVGPFGGLNNTDNPLIISANQAQDLLNVDISPQGKSVKKRKGFGLQFALAVTTSATHGVFNFYDASGNSVDLFFNDRYIQASVNGAALTTLMSTSTLAATWQCVDSLGFAYCASSARDPILKTNGATYGTLSGATPGTLIAITPERLIIGGVSGTPQRLSFSKANDYTTWTVGGAATDPFTQDINAPGSRITHVTYAFGKIIWFKDASFGAILGTDNTNWQVVTISPNLGTLDNTTVYRDGILYFRGQDGHIYAFDGSVARKLTRDLGATISSSSGRRSNSWTVSSASDFTSGNLTSTVTYTAIGVTISTNSTAPPDNSFESNSWSSMVGVWSRKSGVTGSGGGCSITPLSGSWVAACDNTSPVTASLVDSVSGTSYGSTAVSYSIESCSWTPRTITVTGASAKTYVKLKMQCGSNPANTTTSPSFAYDGNGSVTFNTASQLEAGSAHTFITVDVFGGGQTTMTNGVYYSAVHNAPNLTSWDSFTANTVSDGTQAFFIRSSTSTFTVLSSTPSWVSQTVGSLITASTGTYFQMKDSFTVTAASQTPSLQNFTFNWYEGTASDKAYAIYHDNAIWWAVASGAGATTNNYILRYDLINSGGGSDLWTLYDIATNGLLVRNNSLYFGSSSVGKIYKFGDATSDDSAAINAYWKSKDFFGDSPFTEKEYRTISVSGASVVNSTCTVTYTINGTSSTAYGISLYDSASSFIKNNKNLPLGRNGSYFNIKFASNAADKPMEIFGALFTFEPKPWRPTP